MTNVMVGILVKRDDKWFVKTSLTNPNYYDIEVPLHPDDIFENYTEHNIHLMPHVGKIVHFKVETICTGSSEWDFMDQDVGKIVMWS